MSEHRGHVEVRTGQLGAVLEGLRVRVVEPRALTGQEIVMDRRAGEGMTKSITATGGIDDQQLMLDRLAQAESMSIEDYRRALAERAHIRATYAQLSSFADAAITLSATGAAPEGLHSTGNPIFAVAGSLLGVPAVSLPLLADEGLPLGLQVLGFEQQDAALIGVAAWVRDMLQGEG